MCGMDVWRICTNEAHSIASGEPCSIERKPRHFCEELGRPEMLVPPSTKKQPLAWKRRLEVCYCHLLSGSAVAEINHPCRTDQCLKRKLIRGKPAWDTVAGRIDVRPRVAAQMPLRKAEAGFGVVADQSAYDWGVSGKHGCVDRDGKSKITPVVHLCMPPLLSNTWVSTADLLLPVT